MSVKTKMSRTALMSLKDDKDGVDEREENHGWQEEVQEEDGI